MGGRGKRKRPLEMISPKIVRKNLFGNGEEILQALDNSEDMSLQGKPSHSLVCLNPRPQSTPSSSSSSQNSGLSEDLFEGISEHIINVSVPTRALTSQEEENVETVAPALPTSNADIEIITIDVPAKIPKKDPLGRGNTLDPSWQEFKKSNVNSKVQCLHCDLLVSAKAPRLRTHLKKCEQLRTPVSRRESEPRWSSERPVPDNTVETPKTSKVRQRKVTSYIDRMTQAEQNEFHMETGRYIYSMNLPFAHVEHPAFLRYVQKLRPACTVPNRRAIAGPILDKTYNEVLVERAKLMSGKFATIIQDGWKTRTSEPVLAHSAKIGTETVFLNAISTEDNKKTAEYCAEKLKSAIRTVEGNGAEVIAVVTDNCSSMVKMRRLIQEEYPTVYTYGCHAHLLNLVGKKLTPDEVLDKVQAVNSFFRSHEIAWAKLKKTGASRPILPCATRWNAWLDCLEYYLNYHAKMLEVSRLEDACLGEEILDILNESNFYGQVKQVVDYMKPVQLAVDMVQKENATLPDGIHAWVLLREKLVFHNEECQKYFTKQYKRALQPVGVASLMLHPIYRGTGLDPQELEAGNNFLANLNPFNIIIAAQLKLMSTVYFSDNMFVDKLLQKCRPEVWWSSQESLGKIDKNVIKLAIKLMQLPTGSADIERHFSTLGNIMNVRRTRLGIDKAGKLCAIYKHFTSTELPNDDELDFGDTM